MCADVGVFIYDCVYIVFMYLMYVYLHIYEQLLRVRTYICIKYVRLRGYVHIYIYVCVCVCVCEF